MKKHIGDAGFLGRVAARFTASFGLDIAILTGLPVGGEFGEDEARRWSDRRAFPRAYRGVAQYKRARFAAPECPDGFTEFPNGCNMVGHSSRTGTL